MTPLPATRKCICPRGKLPETHPRCPIHGQPEPPKSMNIERSRR